MSFMFLLGDGHLSKKADQIARKHEARLVNYNDPGCKCGYGCPPSKDCPATARHWFEAHNLGEPFDSQRKAAVESDLRAAGILK